MQNRMKKLRKVVLVMMVIVIMAGFAGGTVFSANTPNDMITRVMPTVIEFLAWGIGAVGAFITIFGIVTLAMGISQDNSADKQKGLTGIVGGALVVGVGVLIGSLGPQFLTPPAVLGAT